LVYKLGGSARLPDKVAYTAPTLNPPPAFGTAEQLQHGERVYGTLCSTCHGSDGLSRGLFPDLRYSAALGSDQAFRSIVIDGALAKNGMVSFKAALSPEDAEALRAYIVDRARAAMPPPAPPGGHGN
jgi:quinohemoprotein ethanol dehydrogenase